MANYYTIVRPESPIDKAWDNMIDDEIQVLKEWNARVYARHKKTLTPDEHAAIGRNVQQIINLLKSKCA